MFKHFNHSSYKDNFLIISYIGETYYYVYSVLLLTTQRVLVYGGVVNYALHAPSAAGVSKVLSIFITASQIFYVSFNKIANLPPTNLSVSKST